MNVPGLKFGIAFNEASGPRLVRRSGNDDELVDVAVRNAQAIGAGHVFVVALREGFPVHVLNAVKAVPEVCRVFCATANPLEVVVGETEQGRGVLGVIDGSPPVGRGDRRRRGRTQGAAAPIRVQAVSEVSVLPTYRHLVEGIPAVLYVDANDDRSSNLYTSPQIEPLLGFTVEQWRDDPALWFDRIHEDDRERVLEEHRESLRTGDPFRTEYRLLAADGREVWIRDEAVLVREAEHDQLFWRGVMTDITGTKRVEDRLRRSLDVLRRTMEDRRQLLLRLEDAQEEERRRIASDIHDDPIQVMSAADIRAQALAHRIEDPELRQEAEELRDVIRSSVERLRHLLFELRPPALDQRGPRPRPARLGGRRGPRARDRGRVAVRAALRAANDPVPDRTGGDRERPQARLRDPDPRLDRRPRRLRAAGDHRRRARVRRRGDRVARTRPHRAADDDRTRAARGRGLRGPTASPAAGPR